MHPGHLLAAATLGAGLVLGAGWTGLGAWAGSSGTGADVEARAIVTATYDPAMRVAAAAPGALEARPWAVAWGTLALPLAAVGQRNTNWCWAASIESTAEYYGVEAGSQCDIVRSGSLLGRVTGGCPNIGGHASEVVVALAGLGIGARSVGRPLTYAEVRAQIRAGRVIIMRTARTERWLTGHMLLIRGIEDATMSLLLANTTTSLERELAAHTLPGHGVPYTDMLSADEPVLTGVQPDARGAGWNAPMSPHEWTDTIITAPVGQEARLDPEPLTPLPAWRGARVDGSPGEGPAASVPRLLSPRRAAGN